MRVPNWLIGIAALAASAQAVLLWCSDVPLGVAGEWTWPRTSLDAAVWVEIVTAAACLGLYGLLVWTGCRRMAHARQAEAAGWLAALFVAGCAWLWVVIETTPGPFGLGRGPYVVFYPRTSGYFLQARAGMDDWPQFLSGYEDELKQGDYLHLGTHPPGLAMGFGLSLQLCREQPAVTDFLLAIRPRSVRDATAGLEANERTLLPPFSRADAACLWLASLLSLLCAVATIWPLFGLLIRAVDRQTAWRLAALWPLVPAVEIFYPKSDLLYPFFAMLFAWLWMTGWERGAVWRCVVAAVVLLLSLLTSLAFLPSAGIVGLASLIRCARDRGGENSRLQLRRAWSAGAALITLASGVAIFWLACDISLLNVWRLNFVNHGAFYAHNHRTCWKWLIVNPLELGVAVGPVVAVLALFGAGRVLKERWRSPLPFSVLIVWAALWLSGKNMGEAARLWIFLMPWLLVVAAYGLRTRDVDRETENTGDSARRRRNWLILIALQAALCLLTTHRVDGFHFGELVEQDQSVSVRDVPAKP
jgi:methylthioxylose transferase